MERTFDFGRIDFQNRGRALDRITVEIRYEEEKGKKCFAASGSIGNVCCGQCLDTIAEYIDDPIFLEIYRLWKAYHLNDMHPECEHQNAAGWVDLAKKEVTLYHWEITHEVFREKEKAEKAAIAALEAGKTFTPTKEQTFYAGLSYSLTTWTPTLPEELAQYYEPEKSLYTGDNRHTETKTLGWLRESEHPDGLLSKPCPVCGYKYGTSWVYFPIPDEDEKIILKLLETGTL